MPKKVANAEPKVGSESIRDTERKRKRRSEEKEVIIPLCADRQRRLQLEADDEEWLRYYFPSLFTYEFVRQQREMIQAIANAVKFGGDQSLAASRGEGKTKICERTLLKYTLQGTVNFCVLFAATASNAQDSLQAMRFEIEKNERLLLDYPETCVPVRALGDTPNRAHYQIVTGHRHDNGEPFHMVSSKFTWCGGEIYLPNVPGSPSALGIIATRGLDSAVRGLNKLNRRPQVAVIDDPDTPETIANEIQAKKLEDNIERGIAQLGGQQRGCARVLLTTIQRRGSVSDRFTNPKIKPSFKGRRFRFMIQKPDRLDLWDEYITEWQANKQLVDQFGNHTDEHSRGAHALYLANREEMDRGAEVANPNRFDPNELPDGSQLEVSAIQRYYNEVARTSPEAVQTEFDNDPPEEGAGPVESGITSHRVQRQLSGIGKGIVPAGCSIISQGIDAKKTGLHWVIRAWKVDDANQLITGHTIDYGFHETHGTIYGSDDGLDTAVRRAILERAEITKRLPYTVDITAVDARWRTDAVYAACAEAGIGFYPIMGFGKSAGCAGPTFTQAQKKTHDVRPGDRWKMVRKGSIWLIESDADFWKTWEHDRWMTDPMMPGAMLLFGESSSSKQLSFDEKGHHAYSRHIVAEVEVEEWIKGILRRRFKPKPGHGQNHYLDASCYADVGGSIKGVRLAGPKLSKTLRTMPAHKADPATQARQRLSIRELAQAARTM